MLNLKLQTNAKDIPNLIRVDISGQDYYFTGDLAEIQNRCIQGQFQNFYPYKDFYTVNDIKAFDSSSVTSQDSPREIVDLIGFRSIEEVQFKQEVDTETQPIENLENTTGMFDHEDVTPEKEYEKQFIEEFDNTSPEMKSEVTEQNPIESETLEETEDYEVPSKKGKKK
jgi:hypothetical protein